MISVSNSAKKAVALQRGRGQDRETTPPPGPRLTGGPGTDPETAETALRRGRTAGRTPRTAGGGVSYRHVLYLFS